MKRFFFLLSIFFIPFLGITQNIKTVQLKPINGNSFAPIVPLGSILELSFDDLDADNKEYQYRIEHMTHDWKPSNLISNQYINGFDNDYINNITNSFNTLQDYTHYSIKIPNQNTIITKSGNYLISVINNDDEIIFTRRCVFYENLTTVGVAVYRSRNVKTTDTQQTIQFLINYPNITINNPGQEINVILFQNNNWSTAISNLKPQFFKPNQLLYNYINKTNFWAGNEFFNFDTKNIRNTNINITHVKKETIFHHYLYTNEARINKHYTYYPDINGEFTIRTLESDEENTEADYATMHFSLEANTPYNGKDVYVYGNFNNYNFSDENKMSYNERDKIYESSITLKQGFYNYNYATIDNENTVNLTEIDGSFYETENEYTVIVYYRPLGENFDRVIGVGNGFFDQNR